MQRTCLSFLFLSTTFIAFAQEKKPDPNVVRSAPKELKGELNALPAEFAVPPGLVMVNEVERPPAVPDCDAVPDRMDCTANAVLAVLRQHAGKPALDLKHAGEQPVTLTFMVNNFGEVKDVRVEHPGDDGISRMAIVAMHDLPKFIPATQGGAKVASTLRFSVAYAEIFAK